MLVRCRDTRPTLNRNAPHEQGGMFSQERRNSIYFGLDEELLSYRGPISTASRELENSQAHKQELNIQVIHWVTSAGDGQNLTDGNRQKQNRSHITGLRFGMICDHR